MDKAEIKQVLVQIAQNTTNGVYIVKNIVDSVNDRTGLTEEPWLTEDMNEHLLENAIRNYVNSCDQHKILDVLLEEIDARI